MIAAGSFPFPGQQVDMDASPRVGDGLIRLDADGVVQYASPNGLSAYHRLGLASDLVGHHLGTTTAELAPSRGRWTRPWSRWPAVTRPASSRSSARPG